MANLRLILRFIRLSPAARNALLALPDHRTALAHDDVDGLGSAGGKARRESQKVKRAGCPAWPPPDGTYWGM